MTTSTHSHKAWTGKGGHVSTTGNFHIRRLYKSPFSIDKKKAPKIVVTSNFPLENNGHSYTRREFIVEVSNYYRLKSEFCRLRPSEWCKSRGL